MGAPDRRLTNAAASGTAPTQGQRGDHGDDPGHPETAERGNGEMPRFDRYHRCTVSVRADLPGGGRIKGNGAIDLKAKRFQTAMTATGVQFPGAGSRIVIGTDSYHRESGDDGWVHVDLKRVRPDDTLLAFDWTDPTGLKTITGAVGRVERTGPHTYTGRVDPDAGRTEPYLPVGAPALISIGMNMSPFTATTDAEGWVTSIVVELTPPDGGKLMMTTSMSGHGKPLAVKKPARFDEAAELYYR
jgi:hypothetical protein